MKQSAKKIDWIVLFVVLIGNALVLWSNAFKTFNFFDFGIFLDGAWRIYQGQQPYVDFIIATGPIHHYLIALFFFIFGFGKLAFWSHLAFVHSAIIIFTFLLVHRKLPRELLYVVMLVSMTCFYWPISFPWYTHTTHLWGIAGIVLLANHYQFKSSKLAFCISSGIGLLLALAWMTKQNVAAYYSTAIGLTLLFCSYRRYSLPGLFLGLFVGLILLAVLFGSFFGSLIDQVMMSSLQRSGLLMKLFKNPMLFTKNLYWIPAVIVFGNIIMGTVRKDALIVLFFGVWAVGHSTTFSSGSIYESDVPLMGIYLSLAFLLLFSLRSTVFSQSKQMLWRLSIIVLAALSAFQLVLYTSFGMQLRGWSRPHRGMVQNIVMNPIGDYELKTPPLKGWRVDGRHGEPLDQIAKFIKERVPETDSLLVLSDITVLYALTGRDSFKGVTLAFADHSWPTPGEMQNRVRDRIIQGSPHWIVTHDKPVPFSGNAVRSLGLEDFLKKNYGLVKQWGDYVLLRRVDSGKV